MHRLGGKLLAPAEQPLARLLLFDLKRLHAQKVVRTSPSAAFRTGKQLGGQLNTCQRLSRPLSTSNLGGVMQDKKPTSKVMSVLSEENESAHHHSGISFRFRCQSSVICYALGNIFAKKWKKKLALLTHNMQKKN
jgi:hypothetical protein